MFRRLRFRPLGWAAAIATLGAIAATVVIAAPSGAVGEKTYSATIEAKCVLAPGLLNVKGNILIKNSATGPESVEAGSTFQLHNATSVIETPAEWSDKLYEEGASTARGRSTVLEVNLTGGEQEGKTTGINVSTPTEYPSGLPYETKVFDEKPGIEDIPTGPEAKGASYSFTPVKVTGAPGSKLVLTASTNMGFEGYKSTGKGIQSRVTGYLPDGEVAGLDNNIKVSCTAEAGYVLGEIPITGTTGTTTTTSSVTPPPTTTTTTTTVPTTTTTTSASGVPVITKQPAPSLVLTEGENIIEEAEAGDPPALQWQISFNGGATWLELTGATYSPYNFGPAVAAQNGAEFRAVFTNTHGTTISNVSVLTVKPKTTTTTTSSSTTTTTTTTSSASGPVEAPSGAAIYEPSGPCTGGAGHLEEYHPATLNLGVALPGYKAWTVLYQSENVAGAPDCVTGTIITPTAAWTGKGPRPVIDYAEGTQGLAQSCAPSLQMQAGTEYDGGAVIAALKAGYAVDVTDYHGYTKGAVSTYTTGRDEAHAVLDIAKASEQLSGDGVSSSNPIILWGYSQGGQAVGWAGELEQSYAPELDIIGVSAGGVPSNLNAVENYDNGGVGAGFVFMSIVGLTKAYPAEFNLTEFANEAGLKAEEKLTSVCALQAINEFRDVNLSKYIEGEPTLATFEAEHPVVKHLVEEQLLGTLKVPVPVYHYHGARDELVPVAQDAELHQAWCSLGTTDDFQLAPGEHLLTDPTMVPYVMKWIAGRLAGEPAPSTCGLHSKGQLPSYARTTPETGDLEVELPGWEVKGNIEPSGLGSLIGLKIQIPTGTSLTSTDDLTSGKITGNLAIPPFKETITEFGISVVTSGDLVATGPVSGTSSLSNSGVLSVHATGGDTMYIKSLTVGGLPIPGVECKTSKPIELPVNIEGPVNEFATGSIELSETFSIPSFESSGSGLSGLLGGIGCPLVSEVASGSGDKINISTAPPAPISW